MHTFEKVCTRLPPDARASTHVQARARMQPTFARVCPARPDGPTGLHAHHIQCAACSADGRHCAHAHAHAVPPRTHPPALTHPPAQTLTRTRAVWLWCLPNTRALVHSLPGDCPRPSPLPPWGVSSPAPSLPRTGNRTCRTRMGEQARLPSSPRRKMLNRVHWMQ